MGVAKHRWARRRCVKPTAISTKLGCSPKIYVWGFPWWRGGNRRIEQRCWMGSWHAIHSPHRAKWTGWRPPPSQLFICPINVSTWVNRYRGEPLPFIDSNRVEKWRVKEVPTYLVGVVQILFGIFPNQFVWVPFKKAPFLQKKETSCFFWPLVVSTILTW